MNHPVLLNRSCSRPETRDIKPPSEDRINISYWKQGRKGGAGKLVHFHLPAIELFRAIFSADAVDMEPACREMPFSIISAGHLIP